MRPIRAGKIHVPLAAIGGKNNNREKKSARLSAAPSCSSPYITTLTPSARSLCFSQRFLMGCRLIGFVRLGL